MKRVVTAVLLSGAWIGISEFVRNELLFKSYWIEKYAALGLRFPSGTANNALWGAWSLLLALSIAFLARRLRPAETIVITWVMAFVMMWLVIGNLDVLPLGLLLYAVPLSIIEVTLAALICGKLIPRAS